MLIYEMKTPIKQGKFYGQYERDQSLANYIDCVCIYKYIPIIIFN